MKPILVLLVLILIPHMVSAQIDIERDVTPIGFRPLVASREGKAVQSRRSAQDAYGPVLERRRLEHREPDGRQLVEVDIELS